MPRAILFVLSAITIQPCLKCLKVLSVEIFFTNKGLVATTVHTPLVRILKHRKLYAGVQIATLELLYWIHQNLQGHTLLAVNAITYSIFQKPHTVTTHAFFADFLKRLNLKMILVSLVAPHL